MTKEEVLKNVQKNDSDAWDVVFSNPKDEDYLRFAIERAKNDKSQIGDRARAFVYQNKDIGKCWYCIVSLAMAGVESAFNVVLENVRKDGGIKCVVAWALERRDPRAMNIVFKRSEDLCCWNCILALAKGREPRAVDFVIKHPEKDDCRSCVIGLAKSEPKAIDFVLKYSEYDDCRSCVIKMAESGNSIAIDAVIRKAHYDDFWFCVIKLAEQGLRAAMKKVLENPNRSGADACIDVMIKRGDFKVLLDQHDKLAVSYVLNKYHKFGGMKSVVDLARNGKNEGAKNSVFKHFDDPECRNYIFELAQQGDAQALKKIPQLAELGDERAIQIVFRDAEKNKDWRIIVDLAIQGNGDAIEAVLAHPEKDGYWRYVAYCAKKGNAEYQEMVFEHCAENRECEQCVFNMSIAGNRSASLKVLEMAEKGNSRAVDYVLMYPKNPCYTSFIMEMAKNGNSRAVQHVLAHSNDSNSASFIKEKAKENNRKYQEMVCRNLPNEPEKGQLVIGWADSGVELAKMAVLDALKKDVNMLGPNGLSYVIRLARKRNPEAKKIVLSNAKNGLCRQCILELADGGDPDAGAIKNEWKVGLGATVVYRIVQNGIEGRCRIVTSAEHNPSAGKFATSSNFGSLLLGKTVGDRIEIKSIGGRITTYEIVDVFC